LRSSLILSGGMDHYIKMWNLNNPKIQKAIEDSETFTNKTKSFPTCLINFPDFTTRDIHTNYVDCIKWFGDLVLSKVCAARLNEFYNILLKNSFEII
jgi:polycomb protein EED